MTHTASSLWPCQNRYLYADVIDAI
jgi:hypothetical protein